MTYIAAGMLIVPLCIGPLSKVSSSAQGIYSLMSNISSFTTYPSVINALKELDIEASIKVLEKLVKELDIKNKTKTLDESLNLLKECIVNIETELCTVHQQLAYNYGIWYFKYFRTYKFSDSINKLRMLKSQLDNRANIFFKILKANDKLIVCINKNIDTDISVLE